MKFIITESQSNRLWLLRRYDLVKKAFKEIDDYINPFLFDSFEDYERRFLQYMMDELHPYFYEIEEFDYDGVMKELQDMFYVEITESYFGSVGRNN